MTPYIPKVRCFVDWDGDGFINKGVPQGTPPNLVPYAPFPRGLALRKKDGSYSNKFLFNDRYALVAREVELAAGELALFGTDYPERFNPTTNENVLNSYRTTSLTQDGFFIYEDDGTITLADDKSGGAGAVTYFGGTASTTEVPMVSGQAYTLLFMCRHELGALTGGTSVGVVNIANVVRASVITPANGLNYVQWTQPATENVRINHTTGAGNAFEASHVMIVKGSVTSYPDDYNVRNIAVMDEISPVPLAPSTDYVAQVVITADTTCNATVTVFRQNLGSSAYSTLYSGVIALTAGQDYKLQLSVPSDAAGTHLHGQVSLDADATLQMRGYSIYEGTVFYPFSAGDTAGYDEITKDGDVLSAKWDFGRRKFSELLGYEGNAELTLNNTSRRYSPKNEDSPLYGKLGKKNLLAYIELENPEDLTRHKLFTGWTELIDVVVGTNSNMQARLTLRQGMYRLREGAFAPVVFESQKINDVLPTLLEMAGWRYASHPAQAVLDYEQRIGYDAFLPTDENVYEREEDSLYTYDLIGQGWDDDTKISEALEDLLEAEGASFWIGREGQLNFVARTFYLHRPEEIDYTLSLNTVQDGTYEYGRDVASVVSIFAKPKDTAKNQTIWTSKPAIEVNAGEQVRIQLEFSFEGGEPRTVTAVDEDVVLTGYFQTKGRNTTPEPVDAEVLESITATIETDYNGRYVLVLTSNLTRRIWLTAEVKGDYVIGGEGVTYEFSDTDAMLAANGVHRKKLTTFLLTTEEEAEGLAQTIFLRDGLPDGEFTSFSLYSSTPASVVSMITMKTGDRVYLNEYQTDEEDKPHVILGESGQFDGRSLKIKYNVGRLDSTIYGKTGDTIDHEFVDVMEGASEYIGSGGVTKVYRPEVDDMVDVVENLQGVRGIYIRGNEPAIKAGGVLATNLIPFSNKDGVFEPKTQIIHPVKMFRPYRFLSYTLESIGTFSAGQIWQSGLAPFIPAETEQGSNANSTVWTHDAGLFWRKTLGHFSAWTNDLGINMPLPLISFGIAGGLRIGVGDAWFWEKYPLTYLKPSTSYTLFLAIRMTQEYADRDMTMRVVEVAPPPYVSGDGDTTLDDLSFTPTSSAVSFYSTTFTSGSNPVRLELEFDNAAAIPRSYELYEFGLIEGTVAPTELGTLKTKNPNVIRLAV
jgi:hypothetical protein